MIGSTATRILLRGTLCLGALLPAGLAGGLLTACEPESAPREQAVRSIAWAEVEASEALASRVLPGRVEAPESARVGFDVAGRIESLAVDLGDRFGEGEVLGRLDAREYRNRVESSRAELRSARARLEQARADHARQEELHAEGVAAPATLDRAEEALGTARAEVDAARARLQTALEDLEETALRAPYAGAVAARHAEAGERVAPGEPVLAVHRAGALTVRVQVPETLIPAVSVGQRHRVTLPGRGPLGAMEAEVLRVGAGGDRAGLFPVELALEAPPEAVRPGMSAAVRLRLPLGAGREGRVAIPVTAYAAGPGEEAYAFVFDPASSRLARRSISVARVLGEHALVASGLEVGEVVAARGLAFLRDGERVRRLGVGPRRFDSEPEAP